MITEIQILQDKWVSSTKSLIADTVLEIYGDLDFLPKSKDALLNYYKSTGYLNDLDNHQYEYSKNNGTFLVLLEGSEVIGCGGLRRLNESDGELVRLWLKKDKRKLGLGKRIFDQLIKTAQELGYSNVYLDTSNRCVDAINLFKRNGFKECGKYKESIGDLFMRCELAHTDFK